jgi:hypothetical protein
VVAKASISSSRHPRDFHDSTQFFNNRSRMVCAASLRTLSEAVSLKNCNTRPVSDETIVF